MKTIRLLVATVGVLLGFAVVAEPVCTTSSAIQYPASIATPEKLTTDQQRKVVYAALNYRPGSAKWDDDPAKGSWMYEKDDGNVVYAGLTIRTHYLQAAIILSPGNIDTIVCDSDNLKQKSNSIHRKAEPWKATLDDEIKTTARRVEKLGMSDTPLTEIERDMEGLNRINARGVLSEDEYMDLRERLLNSYE